MNNALQQMREYKFNENQNLIWDCIHTMKVYESNGYTKEDYFQIGAMGLLKAIDSYDIRKGMQFSTYAYKCISNELGRSISASTNTKHRVGNTAISLETPVGGEDTTRIMDTIVDANALNGFKSVENVSVLKGLTKAMQTFTEEEKQFFQLRFIEANETDITTREFVTGAMGINVGQYKSLDRKVRIKVAKAFGIKNYDPKFKSQGGIVDKLLNK